MSDSSTSAHSSRRPKKRNGGMTADEKAKWRGMSADEKAMRMQINALNLQTVTPNVFKAGLNSAGAEAASTPKQMPEPQVETVEKIAEVPVPDVQTVEKIVEEPTRTPDAEADAAEAEAERVMFERPTRGSCYGCIDHIYDKLIEVWR